MSRTEASRSLPRARNIEEVLDGSESDDEASGLFSQQSGAQTPAPPESIASSPGPIARPVTIEAAAEAVRRNYIDQSQFPPGLTLGNSRYAEPHLWSGSLC